MNSWSFIGAYKRRLRISLIPVAILGVVIIGLLAFSAITYNNNDKSPAALKDAKDYNDAVESSKYVQISSEEIYDLNITMTETTQKSGQKVKHKEMLRI
jgi:hypothetical protein